MVSAIVVSPALDVSLARGIIVAVAALLLNDNSLTPAGAVAKAACHAAGLLGWAAYPEAGESLRIGGNECA